MPVRICCLMPRDRVEPGHLCTSGSQRLDQWNGRCVAHVVRVGLERQAKHADALARDVPSERTNDAVDHPVLALFVDLHGRADDALVDAGLLRGL